MSRLTLSALYVYPIKSASGISLQTSIVEGQGLKNDRRFMVVDSTGKFLTQRQYPRMALIETEILGDDLHVIAPEMPRLVVSLIPEVTSQAFVEVWQDQCMAAPVSKESHEWLSHFLGITCQLVYMPSDSHRLIDDSYKAKYNLVSFADELPFLLVGEASLQDLNNRLEKPIPMNRFRPNIVIAGGEPFIEDNWSFIQIGEVVFKVVKPCSRCSIPGIDQSSGIQGKEPLSTLASYRLYKGEILFGQHLSLEQPGIVNTGMQVKVIK